MEECSYIASSGNRYAVSRLEEPATQWAGGLILGVGWSVSDDGEPLTTLVYHLGNAEAATASEPILDGILLGEGTTADAQTYLTLIDIRTSGPTVIATVTPAEDQPTEIVARMLYNPDMPLPFR